MDFLPIFKLDFNPLNTNDKMKKRIYTYITLPLFAITVQSMDVLGQYQSETCHKSLLPLHNKSNQKNEKNGIQEILNASPKKKKNENKIDNDFLVWELFNRFQQAQEVDKGSVSSNESTKLSSVGNPSNINVDLEDTKNRTSSYSSDEDLREQEVINYKLKKRIKRLRKKLAKYVDMRNQLKDKKKPSTNLNEDEKNSTYLLPIIYLSTGAIISLLAIKTVNAHSITKTVEK